MVRHLVLVTLALAAAQLMAGEPAIDGRSAPQWTACTGWVKNAPAKYDVANDKGTLVFSAGGARTEMPWLFDLKGLGITGDERYLLVRYMATGMSTGTGAYFLHGEEGTSGGRRYAGAEAVKADGEWHTLAVDLVAVEPLEVTHRLAVKVVVGDGPSLSSRRSGSPSDFPMAPNSRRRHRARPSRRWPSSGAGPARWRPGRTGPNHRQPRSPQNSTAPPWSSRPKARARACVGS